MNHSPDLGEATWQLPDHRADIFAPKGPDFALVIPVINEGQRIRDQLARIAAAALPVDVVIADGGSTDGSLDEAYLTSCGVRALLTKTGPGKLSAQLRMAYAWCLREGYRGVVTIDGNGKDNVEAVADFVAKLRDGFDYVQGSRYRPGGKAENTPLERTIGNRLIHAPMLSIAGRRWFTDTTNGFRGYSARYLLDPRVQPFRDIFMRYELLFYLTVRAGQIGLRVCEVPVRRSYPRDQATPTKIVGHAAKIELLRQTIRAAMGAFRPRN
jgi:dolichol-phosphate mannosyltransferase